MIYLNTQEIRTDHEEIREIKERFNILEIISGIGKSSLTTDRGASESLMDDLWNKYAEGNRDSGGTLCRLGVLLDLDPTTLLNPSNREELLISIHDSARKLIYAKGIAGAPNQEYLDYLKKSFDLFTRSDSSSAKQVCESYSINRDKYVGLNDKDKLMYIMGESQYLPVKGVLFHGELSKLESIDAVNNIKGLYSGEEKIDIVEWSLTTQLLLIRNELEELSDQSPDTPTTLTLKDDQYKLISGVISKWQYFTKRDSIMDGGKFLPKRPLGMDHGTNGVVINRLIANGLILDFEFIPSVDLNTAEIDNTGKRMLVTLNLLKMLDSNGTGAEIDVGAIRLVFSANRGRYNECLSDLDPFSTSNAEKEILDDLSQTQSVYVNQIINGERLSSEEWREKVLATQR